MNKVFRFPDREPDLYCEIEGAAIPKKRPRFSTRGYGANRRVHTYMPQDYVRYKAMVASRFKVLVNSPTNKKVVLSMHFQFEDNRRRDIDNLSGSIMDAMNDIVYFDDHQVVAIYARKDGKKKWRCDSTGKMVIINAAATVSVWMLEN